MRRLRAFAFRILGLFDRHPAEDDFAAELESHIALHMDDGIRAGLTPEEARRQALIRLGGAEQTRQAHRERRLFPWMDSLLQDTRYGWRTLRKNPSFTITTVLTLALGIGACTAIFSILNAVVLRSLPYGDPERLVYVLTPNPHLGANVPIEAFGPSYADFFDIQRQTHSFAEMTTFEQTYFNLTSQSGAVPIGAARVDGNFFSTLQSFPEIGRAILAGDNHIGHSHVVVISHALWQSMFAKSPQVLGKFLRLDRQSYQVIGVMSPEFGYPHSLDFPPGVGSGYGAQTDVWIPLALTPQQRAGRDNASGYALGRLKPGVSMAQARMEMSTIMARLDLLHSPELRGWGGYVQPLRESSIGPLRKLMWLLLGAVVCVLLIACGNAANLLLARAAARTHELGVRITLGAAKGRIVRQLLTESLLLGVSAGIVGIAIAYLFLHGLLRMDPGNIPRLDEASIDGRVLLFTLITSVLTSIAFGVLPAFVAARPNTIEFLKSGGSRGSIGRSSRIRNSLVIAELAFVVSLLAGAGLLLRSYAKVASVKTGFLPSTISMSVSPDAQYGTRAQRFALLRNLLGKIEAIPGVESAGVINALPLSGSESLARLSVDGDANAKDQPVNARSITPGYFSAMGIPLLRGRFFEEGDVDDAPSVIIVNHAFASKYFGGRDPVGHRIRTSGPDDPWETVVGVVGDVHHSSLEAPALPETYEPLWQKDIDGSAVVVRSTLPPDSLGPSLRTALRQVDPNLAFSGIETMAQLTAQARAKRRFQTTLLTLFAAMAMLLGAVGINGVLAYTVQQRSAEIGVRIALGASRAGVLGLILLQGLRVAALGLLLGLGGAAVLTRVLSASLFEVSRFDPITFLAVPAVLLLVVIGACLVPALRAASIDPMRTLRAE
ncbi:MAG: ABC transporter permease [Acidobacteriaceae bacterium]